MTHYIRHGNHYDVSPNVSLDVNEVLPIGTYTVKFNERAGVFYLDTIDDFTVSGKFYGDVKKTTKRILDTFKDRDSATGVMLSGEKGSGKTLQAKLLSLEAMEKGIPTIVINQPWVGDDFNAFMQLIEQPVVVIFDEFEKVYDREDQEKLLTLFDGVYPTKKLFVITCNDKYKVNEHMRNRPGRIYYRLDYKGLDTDFITEYCADNLLNKAYTESLCRLSVVFSEFNFDILKAMVEEMNRYGETPQEVMRVLNAKPELGDTSEYNVRLTVNGKEIVGEELYHETWRGNPLNSAFSITYIDFEKRDSDGDPKYMQAKFTVTDLNQIDADSGKFHFINTQGDSVSLEKVKVPEHNWNAI